MDTLLFLATFVAAGLVLGWYMRNELAGADGVLGLLGVRTTNCLAESPDDGGPAYRVKPRRALSRLTRLPTEHGGAFQHAAAGRAYRSLTTEAYRPRDAVYQTRDGALPALSEQTD